MPRPSGRAFRLRDSIFYSFFAGSDEASLTLVVDRVIAAIATNSCYEKRTEGSESAPDCPTHGKLFSVNRPHLVILVEVGTIPLKGGCASCKDVHFTAGIDHIGKAQEQHSKLESLFREHFRKVHKDDPDYPV